MEITQVKIFPVQEDKLKAFVSVVFDQCFMVNDIKVIQGKDGLFLSMPSRRKKSGEFKDVAHPLKNEMRRRLEESVLAEYRSLVDDATPRRPDREASVGLGELPKSFDEALIASQPPAAARPSTAGPSTSPSPVPSPAPSAPAPAPESRPVAVSEGGPSAGADEDESHKTLEEVQEIHLRDSFWNVS